MKQIVAIAAICLLLGCIDNRDSRYQKAYFSDPKETPPSTAYYNYDRYATSTSQPQPPKNISVIRIASWNLQRFGPEKASDEELLRYYASKLNFYDIAIIQEITDGKEEAFKKLASMTKNTKYFLSIRLGNTSYKEQYGVIYRNMTLVNTSYIINNVSSRYPLKLSFQKNSWSFDIVTAHTSPENAQTEIKDLSNRLSNTTADTIVIGDLNADCAYYKPKNDFANWTWVINDTEDTTSGPSDCAYDRIIINEAAKNNFVNSFVMTDVNPSQTDHYMVTATFDTLTP